MKKSLIAFAVLSVALCGCASSPLDYKSGTEVTQEQMAKFPVGKTTQSQVIAEIGQPDKKEALSGKEDWYYSYSKISAFFGGNINESTVFEWDPKGKLLQVYKTGKSEKSGNALLDAANGNK